MKNEEPSIRLDARVPAEGDSRGRLAALAVLLVALLGLPGASPSREPGQLRSEPTSSATRSAASEVFRVEDGLRIRQFVGRSPVDLSPDGRLLAYSVSTPGSGVDDGGSYTSTGIHSMVTGSRLMVTDLRTGEHRDLTGERGSSWGPRWSPDGALLAFYSDREGRPRLHLWHRQEDRLETVDGVTVRTLFPFEVPHFSPDGSVIYTRALTAAVEDRYAAEPAGWPWERALEPESEGKGAIGESSAADRVAGGTPDFVRVYDGRLDTAGDDGTDRPDRSVDPGGEGVIDIVGVEARTGRVRRILRERAVRDLVVSPDGRWIAATVTLGLAEEGTQQPLFEVLLADTSGREPPRSLLTLRQGYGKSLSFSPDSTRLAVVSVSRSEADDVLVVDLADGAVGNRTETLEVDLAPSSETYEPPIWTPDGRWILWAADGDLWRIAPDGDEEAVNLTADAGLRVAGLVHPSDAATAWVEGATADASPSILVQSIDPESLESGFATVGLDGSGMTSVLQETKRYGGSPLFHIDVDRRRETVVYGAESGTESPDLWLLKPGDTPTRVTAINATLDRIDPGELRRLSWTTRGGRSAEGILMLPPDLGAGEKAPLVLWVYAGSRPSRRIQSFGFAGDPASEHPALFTSRGYALLYPDIPMGDAEPLADIVDAVEPALDAAIATGRIDPGRIGVFGHSYGGYTVNVLVTQTDRFAAAVASTGSANLLSYFGQRAFPSGGTGWFEEGQGRMGGTPWEEWDRYVANSPFRYLDRVTTPLLLVHSEDDDAFWQSAEMFGGLRRLGRPVKLLRYRDAHHWYGAWSRDKLIDFWDRVFRWFDEYLRPPSG